MSGAFIDRTPAWLKDFAIATFGTNDKRALLIGTVIVLALVCGLVGMLARRRSTPACSLFTLIGLVGTGAVLTRPGAAPLDIVPTVLGVVAGLWFLSRSHPTASATSAPSATGSPRNPARRWLVGAIVGGVAAYLGGSARQGLQRSHGARARPSRRRRSRCRRPTR